ncbi:EAL domain-containing protein [Arenimonas sp.]|uniref:EAL domain-containing protein n=1 Tax=Arenimonas sp. TaxID=1872635 RepID=UPI0039E57B50
MGGERNEHNASGPDPTVLRSFFEGAPFQMGITELIEDEDLLLVSVNQATANANGMKLEDLQGKRISELGLSGPRNGVWLEKYLEALRTGQPVNFEQASNVPGSHLHWQVTLTHLGAGPSGRPRFSYVVQDITQRKRDERTQRALYRISEAAQSAETLSTLFSRIHDIVDELLPARNFFVALYDRGKDELSFPYYVDEHDAPPPATKLDDSTLSGRVVRLGIALLFTPETPNEGVYREDGYVGTASSHWLGVPLKTQSGTIGALVVQSYSGEVHYEESDKTLLEFVSGQVAAAIERKQAEMALRLSESRLEESQRLAHLGSWNWDAATETLTWSDELCRIYGVDPAMHRPSFGDFIRRLPEEDRAPMVERFARATREKKDFSHETRVVRPDGEVRTLFDKVEILRDGNGEVTGLAGACLDITSRKRNETLERDRARILELVAQDEPLPAVLAHVIEALEHQRPGMHGSLTLLRDGKRAGTAAPSMPADYIRTLHAVLRSPDGLDFSNAVTSGEPVLVADTTAHPAWTRMHRMRDDFNIQCCWSMPILSAKGAVLGVLNLLGTAPRECSDRDRRLLESVSRLAAVAIEHRELTDKLAHQAQHDALTGLPNRLLFQDRLGQALAQAQRSGRRVAVLYMDLDRFKHINDTLGHSPGDALLCQVAARLAGCVRGSDTLARVGGDEFTLVLTELEDARDAIRVAQTIVEAMRRPFELEGRELFVTMSLGVSLYPDDGAEAATLMVNADVAMYRAKEVGRDNFQWFDAEMNRLARERMELEWHLRYAMQLGQLALAYQPQVDADGNVLAFEALLRWRHPSLGEVSPSRFIPLAEDNGLIVSMGEWALREACEQAAHWRRAGHPNLCMSVNVSVLQFNRSDFVDSVRRALQDAQLPPEALELEITETLLLKKVQESAANLIELRELGVGVAIDDFGTGYSSLSYLHKLPIGKLKVDQSFVREIGTDATPGHEDAPIVRTIINLAHNLGMSVVAEGVETEVQRELLLRLGCDALQGFLLHPPLDPIAAGRLLDTQRRVVA